jgi:hypothetical protein
LLYWYNSTNTDTFNDYNRRDPHSNRIHSAAALRGAKRDSIAIPYSGVRLGRGLRQA